MLKKGSSDIPLVDLSSYRDIQRLLPWNTYTLESA